MTEVPVTGVEAFIEEGKNGIHNTKNCFDATATAASSSVETVPAFAPDSTNHNWHGIVSRRTSIHKRTEISETLVSLPCSTPVEKEMTTSQVLRTLKNTHVLWISKQKAVRPLCANGAPPYWLPKCPATEPLSEKVSGPVPVIQRFGDIFPANTTAFHTKPLHVPFRFQKRKPTAHKQLHTHSYEHIKFDSFTKVVRRARQGSKRQTLTEGP